MNEFIVNQYEGTVELTVKQWKVLDTLDSDFVMRELTAWGASSRSVEYNNHFGRYVAFSVDKLEDAKKVTARLLEMVNGPKGKEIKQCAI